MKRLPKELGDIADLEPAHQVEAMYFNRTDADRQPLRNVAVGVPLGNQAKNFLLPGCEPSRSGT